MGLLGDILMVATTSLSVTTTRRQFQAIVSMDRNDACEALRDALSDHSASEWRKFDLWFVMQGVAEIHPLRRARAMELYAFIKDLEAECLGEALTFHSATDSIG